MAEKTIYIEVHDSIGDIVAKIANSKSEELFLVVPRGAVLLQSLINLRLLKSQADILGKVISLSTEGGLGENLAREAGLNLMETLPARKSESVEIADASVSEIPVADNEGDEGDEHDEEDEYEEPQEAVASIAPAVKLSRWPIFRRQTLGSDLEMPDDDTLIPVKASSPANRWSDMVGRFKLPKAPKVRLRLEAHHKVAMLIVLAGLVVLGSVGYFVIPRAYVALEVQAEAYKKQFALVVADQDDLQAAGPNLVTGRYLEAIHENTASFPATGEKNRGAKSEGKITIVNTTGTIAGLLANTRFQAPNGLIFRTKFEILVPPAHGSSAGRAVVDAVADDGGAKYNIAAGTRLTVPGLGAAGKDSVYGDVTAAFSGGTDDIIKVVSEDDINKAKDEAAKNVFASSEAELNTKLKKGEEIPKGFIQNDIIDALPSVSLGTEQDHFDVRVQSRSWALAVKSGKVAEALANAANFEVPEGKQVTTRTLDTAKVEVVESNFLTHRINLVVSLDGHIGPKVDLPTVVDHLANQPLDSAKTYLQSVENVSSSSIELWPSFLKRVPMLRGNIRAKVVYIGE